jgi:hypothetical protein
MDDLAHPLYDRYLFLSVLRKQKSEKNHIDCVCRTYLGYGSSSADKPLCVLTLEKGNGKSMSKEKKKKVRCYVWEETKSVTFNFGNKTVVIDPGEEEYQLTTVSFEKKTNLAAQKQKHLTARVFMMPFGKARRLVSLQKKVNLLLDKIGMLAEQTTGIRKQSVDA